MADEQKGFIFNDRSKQDNYGIQIQIFESQISELTGDDPIVKSCYILFKYLVDLKTKCANASVEELPDLKQNFKKCRYVLQFLIEVALGDRELPFELPQDLSPENLLSDVWEEEEAIAVSIEDCSGWEGGESVAHLILSLFWQERSKQTVRVQPELFYHDPKTDAIECLPLSDRDIYPVKIPDFPDVLQPLVTFAEKRLRTISCDSLKPWQLTINLLVPIELLCYPLKQWCGESSQLTCQYPIVVRCSDRFDMDNDRAHYFYNQLLAGWQRFSRFAQHIRQLNWLKPDGCWQGDLEGFGGLQCFGDWLKPDDLDRWGKLVESGIPLALWMYETGSDRELIAQTFDWLTDCSCSEFLRRTRQERREPCRLSVSSPGYHLGVFYENPNYVPTVLQEEEQFFSWAG